MCHTYNFYFINTGFLEPENMRVDSKIVYLSGLQVNISPKSQFNECSVAILFWSLKIKDAKLASA